MMWMKRCPVALMLLVSACAAAPPTDTRATFCAGMAAALADVGASVPDQGADDFVIAVDRLVRTIDAGC